jgi:hypothetical protein
VIDLRQHPCKQKMDVSPAPAATAAGTAGGVDEWGLLNTKVALTLGSHYGKRGVVRAFEPSTKKYKVSLEFGEGEVDCNRDELRTIHEHIRAIQHDGSLDSRSKMREIQRMMLPLAEAASSPAADRSSLTSRTVPKCQHYVCECVIIPACCGVPFQCRLCHDEHVTDHKIDRYIKILIR